VSFLNRVILVVDDDPDICWALDHLLGHLGPGASGRLTARALSRQPSLTVPPSPWWTRSCRT